MQKTSIGSGHEIREEIPSVIGSGLKKENRKDEKDNWNRILFSPNGLERSAVDGQDGHRKILVL